MESSMSRNTSTKSNMYDTSQRKRSLYRRRFRRRRSSRSKSNSAAPNTENEDKYSGLVSLFKSMSLIVVSAVVAYFVYSIVEAQGLGEFFRQLRVPDKG